MTYSSRNAWNNFWHFSANSSFTISPAFSVVVVATSMTNSPKKLQQKNLQTTSEQRLDSPTHTGGAVWSTQQREFRAKRPTRDLWRAVLTNQRRRANVILSACSQLELSNAEPWGCLCRALPVSTQAGFLFPFEKSKKLQWKLIKDSKIFIYLCLIPTCAHN